MFASPKPTKQRMRISTPIASPPRKLREKNSTMSPDLTPLTPFSSFVDDKDLLPYDKEEYPMPSRSATPCGTANSSPFTSAFSTPEKK
jgi:hypothetical protein